MQSQGWSTDWRDPSSAARSVLALLHEHPASPAGTLLGSVQALLAAARWTARAPSDGAAARVDFGVPDGAHSLELVFRSRGPAEAVEPAFEFSKSAEGDPGWDRLNGMEFVNALRLMVLALLRGTDVRRSASRTASHVAARTDGPRTDGLRTDGLRTDGEGIGTERDGTERDGTERDGTEGAAAAPLLLPMGTLARKIELIRTIGHFTTALFSLIGDVEREPLTWDDCLRAWRLFRERAERGECPAELGLYLHVPVCAHRCTYCQIPVHIPRSRQETERLLATMDYELDRYAEAMDSYPIRAMAVGGGTPNLLTVEQTHRLLSGVFERFTTEPLFHLTVDLSPQAATLEKLRAWREYRTSRVSIGVQSLTGPVLKRINRPQSTAAVVRAVTAARQVGIEAVAIDLIAGLPGETVSSFLETLEAVTALQPDQIQIFRWVLEPKCADFQIQGPMTPQQMEERERILAAARDFMARGDPGRLYFCREATFGLDYISRTGDLFHVSAQYEELRSDQYSVLAVGLGAVSHAQGALRYSSSVPWTEYLDWPEHQVSRPFYGSSVSREFAMATRWAATVDNSILHRSRFRAEFGISPEEAFPEEIDFLLRRGLLRRADDAYVVPRGIGREEAIIAGALVFSLEHLERARSYQLFLEGQEPEAEPDLGSGAA